MSDLSYAAAVNSSPFTRVPGLVYCPDPTQAENELMQRAAAGEALAQIWQSPLSLVVPGSYRRFTRLEQVQAEFAAAGCPVWLRRSGGGLVPQGPGILNLSLVYPMARTLGEAAEEIYQHLCSILSSALAELGVTTGWQAVEGSFCDGRFNLACGEGEQARKIAGTAQYWQSVPGQAADAPRRHVVLAQAVLLVDCNLVAAHRYANQFESALESGRHYQAGKTVSVAQQVADAGPDLQQRVIAALHRAIVRYPAPN